ncbi:hypothetical protein DM02DRAFT_169524 [Periconia macrospinosa]|uniref:Uncharacterized protein n=1 Tax=Periconia macrospinosa TaxID=97972 RepID=A0A2V1DAG7_9PLEO|nr:hypothetical protein DM02DRAFT_169524 [Periconia macrospinosa]
MRSFQQVVLFLFAFALSVFAQQYDETVYVTSTIYRVNTVTATGTPPAGGPVNSTLTIAPTPPVAYATAQPSASASFSVPGNATAPKPTGSTAPVQPSSFPGAASGLSVNGAVVAMVAAGLGFLAL